jgi:adenylate cyclase
MAEHGAIVFTDIVGFTALTDLHGDDAALALLERQEQMVRVALPTGARVIKELGDGLLLWFDDPREAIDTCLRLQRDFDAMNDAADSSDVSTGDIPLWVRMGVHFGCPRRRGDDIVGRDVNLAARIVDLAGPGEVLCSEVTAEAIGDRPGVGFEPLGPVFVRGITEPVPIVRVLDARTGTGNSEARATGTSFARERSRPPGP